MSDTIECDGYNCTGEPVTKLKAWGPGEIRSFCDECAAVREDLSGYISVGETDE